MKWMALLLAAAFSACAWADSAADKAKLPPIVLDGLREYKVNGAQSAINAWLFTSPLVRNEQLQRHVADLRHFEEIYGVFKDFQVVRTIKISETSQMVYIQLDYATGPAFGKMLAFRSKDSTWSVVSMRFSSDPEELWTFSPLGSAY